MAASVQFRLQNRDLGMMMREVDEDLGIMRKLAPPNQDDGISCDNPKKSSLENLGFGRSLSKRSLDMAIRHMDIRRSISILDNLRPVATAISSFLSSGNQSSSSQSSTVGFSESSLTSASDSSKSSNSCINSILLMGGEWMIECSARPDVEYNAF